LGGRSPQSFRDFALAIFRRYVGEELTITVVAKVKDAPDIDKLRFPLIMATGFSTSPC
jgi:hypothetical protein